MLGAPKYTVNTPPTTRPPSPSSPTTQDLLSATSAAAVAQHQPGSSRSRSGWRRLKIRPAAWAQELVCGLLLLQPAAWAQDPVVLKIRRGLKIRPVAWAKVRLAAVAQDTAGGLLL
jgi:hypothetical protein